MLTVEMHHDISEGYASPDEPELGGRKKVLPDEPYLTASLHNEKYDHIYIHKNRMGLRRPDDSENISAKKCIVPLS